MARGTSSSSRRYRPLFFLGPLLLSACVLPAHKKLPDDRKELPSSPQVAVHVAETDPEITRLLAKLETDDSASRKQTREEILALGPKVVPHLLERIEDPEFLVRWKVVNLLGYLKDTRAMIPLVDRVVADSNPHVRWRGLWALAVMRQDDAITAELRRRMEDEALRWHAAVGLSMFGSPEAIPVLLEGISSDDAWIRFEAVNGLGRSFDDQTSTALLTLLEHPGLKTRQETTMSLGKIRDEVAVQGLIKALEDSSASVRWRAAMNLKLAGDQQAVEALTELLETEADEEVLEHARETLQHLRKGSRERGRARPGAAADAPSIPAPRDPTIPEGPRATQEPAQAEDESGRQVAALIPHLAGGLQQRKKARDTLLALGSGVLPHVCRSIEHSDFVVRWEIVNLLGNLEDPRGVDPLIDRILFDVNHHVRWRAIWALAALRVEPASDKFIPYLEHRNKQVQWRAAVGASMFDRMEAIPVLLTGLRSANSFTRWEAVNALARTHNAETTAAVLPMLEDSDKGVRHETVLCLSHIADPQALKTLVELLDHSDPQIRWRAAMGLGFARHRPAVGSLKQRLELESEETVRDHLQRAIHKLERRRS